MQLCLILDVDWTVQEWDEECKALTGCSCRYDFVNVHYYGTSPEEVIQTMKVSTTLLHQSRE